MELPIDENWRIKTDTNQWIVQKRILANKDKQEYEWRSQSYHMTLEQAVRSLGNRLLRESPAVTFEEAIKASAEISGIMRRALGG